MQIGHIENRFDNQVGIKDFHMEGGSPSGFREDIVSFHRTEMVLSFMEFPAFGSAPPLTLLVGNRRTQTLPKGVFHLLAHEKSPLDSTYHHRVVII